MKNPAWVIALCLILILVLIVLIVAARSDVFSSSPPGVLGALTKLHQSAHVPMD